MAPKKLLPAERAGRKTTNRLEPGNAAHPRSRSTLPRALVEMASIVFLFYSNLLMGEFTRANGRGKTLTHALGDIFTASNLLIAIVSAAIAYVVFERLRKLL